jgi:DMSO/TMAO reductase YedYZ heme-binding membrane subunit
MDNTTGKRKALSYVAIVGNVTFALWMLYNGISEGFRGTRPEVVSYAGLTALLVLNTSLLARPLRRRAG